jgi:hypothetical protein
MTTVEAKRFETLQLIAQKSASRCSSRKRLVEENDINSDTTKRSLSAEVL